MKSATLVTALTRLTTAMAVAAPMVVFGFLYFVKIQPERAAADVTRSRLTAARDDLARLRSIPVTTVSGESPSASRAPGARTTDISRAGEFAGALTAMLKSPAVGGVSNLSIESGAPVHTRVDPMVRALNQDLAQVPVTVTFDARYEQIGRFFWNLRVLPTPFNLQTVELTPLTASADGLMRAKVKLLAFHTAGSAALAQPARTGMADTTTPPEWGHNPFATAPRPGSTAAARPLPDPVVNSIVFSRGRRAAIVEGHVVSRGDRVRGGVVLSIEPDAVVIAETGGNARRVEISRTKGRTANH